MTFPALSFFLCIDSVSLGGRKVIQPVKAFAIFPKKFSSGSGDRKSRGTASGDPGSHGNVGRKGGVAVVLVASC